MGPLRKLPHGKLQGLTELGEGEVLGSQACRLGEAGDPGVCVIPGC